MLERRSRRQAGCAPQLPGQLEAVQGIQQIDVTRVPVDHLNGKGCIMGELSLFLMRVHAVTKGQFLGFRVLTHEFISRPF
ncbi:hypothetical protein D3C81_2036020 [compost metagenome]